MLQPAVILLDAAWILQMIFRLDGRIPPVKSGCIFLFYLFRHIRPCEKAGGPIYLNLLIFLQFLLRDPSDILFFPLLPCKAIYNFQIADAKNLFLCWQVNQAHQMSNGQFRGVLHIVLLNKGQTCLQIRHDAGQQFFFLRLPFAVFKNRRSAFVVVIHAFMGGRKEQLVHDHILCKIILQRIILIEVEEVGIIVQAPQLRSALFSVPDTEIDKRVLHRTAHRFFEPFQQQLRASLPATVKAKGIFIKETKFLEIPNGILPLLTAALQKHRLVIQIELLKRCNICFCTNHLLKRPQAGVFQMFDVAAVNAQIVQKLSHRLTIGIRRQAFNGLLIHLLNGRQGQRAARGAEIVNILNTILFEEMIQVIAIPGKEVHLLPARLHLLQQERIEPHVDRAAHFHAQIVPESFLGIIQDLIQSGIHIGACGSFYLLQFPFPFINERSDAKAPGIFPVIPGLIAYVQNILICHALSIGYQFKKLFVEFRLVLVCRAVYMIKAMEALCFQKG